jgi:hypothetical protein
MRKKWYFFPHFHFENRIIYNIKQVSNLILQKNGNFFSIFHLKNNH